MKKLFTLIITAFIFSAPSLKAQVLFLETFDNIPGPTAGGPGTYVFPTGWLLANVDNRVPDPGIAYVDNAWIRREDFKFNVSDSAAFSTSFYSPPGQADDWMWTPAISITGSAATRLSWNAVTYDAGFPDGYEVRIMTVPPTGSTGVLGNMVSASTLLFSIPAENTAWINRSVDISAYNGSTVYIGFRNHTNDEFLLLIDDVKVDKVVDHDAQTTDATSYEYTQLPFNQVSSVSLGGVIKNSGALNITNVNLKADIYDNLNAVVYSASGTAASSLSPGVTDTFTIPSWTAPAKGIYTIKYYPVLTESDVAPENDTIIRHLVISDSVYARDNGNIVGSLGIGAGEVGYLGQAFTVTTPVYLTSVTSNYTRGYTGRKYAAVLWNTTVAGVPNSIIASTDTLNYPSNNALLTTIPVHGGKFFLNPGNYVVTAIEFDSTLALGITDSIFTPVKEWANWPSNGGWSNVEGFGASFAKPFYLRLNISTPAELPLRLISFTGSSTSKGNKLAWKVGEQSGIQAYNIERSSDGVHFTMIGSVKANSQSTYTYNFNDANPVNGINFYRLKIVDYLSVSYSAIIRLTDAGKNAITLSPNPVKNTITLQSNNLELLNTKATLRSLDGKLLKQMQINQLPFSIDMSNLSKGLYLLQLEDKSVFKIIKQ